MNVNLGELPLCQYSWHRGRHSRALDLVQSTSALTVQSLSSGSSLLFLYPDLVKL